MTELLDAAALGSHLGRFEGRLFRMETLPEYAVDSDGDDFQRWRDGAAEPTWDRLSSWLNVLREERAAGKLSCRVRIFSAQPTEYERYACEFGYRYTAQAGEEIRVLRRGEHSFPADLVERDFWIVDDDQVVTMHYDERGRFEGAEILGAGALAEHIKARDTAWDAAEPFPAWWSRHPELHRSLTA